MQISLSDDEAAVLVKVAKQYYSDLREEIYRTEAFEVKNELKREESILKAILDRLTSAQPPIA